MPNINWPLDSSLKIEADLKVYPLKEPYKLSFAELKSFESICVKVTNPTMGESFGAAVALPGYSWETSESIKKTIDQLAQNCRSYTELYQQAKSLFEKNPFAVSAVISAAEIPFFQPQLRGSSLSIALNQAISAEDSFDITEKKIRYGLESGRAYFKLKIGKNLDNDIHVLEALQKIRHLPVKLTADANQAYTWKDIEQLMPYLTPLKKSLLWLEQPFKANAWEVNERFCQQYKFPLLLDESIFTEKDIMAAKEIGAVGIKLKLVKSFGISGALKNIKLAHKLGLKVLFGNGVATEVDNYAEAIIHATANKELLPMSEASGFDKIANKSSILKNHQGHLSCSF